MTLVEYGVLSVKMVNHKPECIITCTIPDKLLGIIAKVDNDYLTLKIGKNSIVFVDIPREYLNDN